MVVRKDGAGRDASTSQPILVTGSHRSGTTWVGKMLSIPPNVVLVHEPFHPELAKSWLRTRPPNWLQYVGPENAQEFARGVQDIIDFRPPGAQMLRRCSSPREAGGVLRELLRARRGAARKARPLLKDPLAFFAAEWLAARFSAQVVVLVRHPAAFASSLKRLHWTFDFDNFLRQPLLLQRYLSDFRDEIEAAARTPPDIVDQAILLWRCTTSVTLRYQAEHPDWLVLRYEDLASDPLDGFASLYRTLGLDWSEAVEQQIAAHSSSDNRIEVAAGDKGGVRRDSAAAMWTWHGRLTADEVRRVRAQVGDVAGHWYGAQDWVPPAQISR